MAFAAVAFAAGTVAANAASNGLVFIDASASVKDFGDAYRISMRSIGSVARDGIENHRKTIHFIPIGDSARPQRSQRAATSRLSDSQLVAALAGPFSFEDRVTHIASTLRSARTIPSVSEILLVTDMAPDHRPSGGQWDFSVQDMTDLLEAKAQLAAYLSSPGLTQMKMVLLGWQRPPADVLSADERADPDAFLERTARRNREALGSSTDPEREHSAGDLYERAAAAVLVSLQKAHPDKLRIELMPRERSGTRNEQQFFLSACSVFVDVLGQDARCRQSEQSCVASERRPVKTSFKLAVDLGKFRADAFLLPTLQQRFAAPLADVSIGPARTIAVSSFQDAPPADADFVVRLCPARGSGADLACRQGFATAELSALAWEMKGKLPGGMQSLVPLQLVGAGGRDADQAARSSLADDIAGHLRSVIRDHYQPPQRTLWMVLKRSDGRPMPRGQIIRAKFDIGGLTDTRDALVAESTGSVVFSLPDVASNVHLIHFSKRSRSNGQDGELEIGDVPDAALGSCEIHQHLVPDNLFVPYGVVVRWPESRVGEAAKKGRLEVRLEGSDHLQDVVDPVVEGSTRREVSLPPGRYSLKLNVADPRMLTPNVIRRPWDFEIAQDGIRVDSGMQLANRGEIVLTVDLDTLLRPIDEAQAIEERSGPVPNYIAPPAQSWSSLSALLSGDELPARGQEMVRRSANVFWGMLTIAGELVTSQATGRVSPDIPQEQVLVFFKAVQQLLAAASNDREIRDDLYRNMERVGLADMSGELDAQALLYMQLLMTRLVDDQLCSRPRSPTAVGPRWSRELLQGYNEWLVQSSVEQDHHASNGAQETLRGRLPSNTPFTTELVRRCMVPLQVAQANP